MGPLSHAQLPEEEGSVSAPTCCDSVPSSRGGGSWFSSTGQTVSVCWHLRSLQMRRPGFTALQGISRGECAGKKQLLKRCREMGLKINRLFSEQMPAQPFS